MQDIIVPPVKHHLNGVSLECRCWLYIKRWLGSFEIFEGSVPILLKKHFCDVSEGFKPPVPPPSESVHVGKKLLKILLSKSFLEESIRDTGKCIRQFAGIYAYCRYFIDQKW